MVLETSDRVYAIDFGSLIGTGRPDEIRDDEKVTSAYFGVDEALSASGAGPAAEVLPGELAGELEAEYEPARAGLAAVPATVIGAGSRGGAANGSSAAPPPLLEARGLYSGYGAIPVIRDINIRVGRGEVVALLGANGAGKTTTLLTLAGVLSPSSGSVESHGTLLRSGLDRRSRQGLGVVFEERGIIPSLSTADNLRLGRGGVEGAVALFPELEGLLSRRAGLLSGGEQQILTVARALAASPGVILVDELSLGLAPKVVERLLRVIRAAVDEDKLGVLLVEQRIHTALRFADRAAIIRRGEIVFQDDAGALRGNASRIAEHYFAAT
jgi:branched-chain amino acid transport system ATP-binding protein